LSADQDPGSETVPQSESNAEEEKDMLEKSRGKSKKDVKTKQNEGKKLKSKRPTAKNKPRREKSSQQREYDSDDSTTNSEKEENCSIASVSMLPALEIESTNTEYHPRSPRESDRPEYAGTNIAFLEDIPAEPTNASSRPFDPAIEPFSGKEDVVEFLNAFSAAGQERNASTRQVFECIRKKKYYTGNAALQIETWKIGSDSAHTHLFTSVSNPAVVLANYKEFRRLMLSTYLKKNQERQYQVERDNMRLEDYVTHRSFGNLMALVNKIGINLTQSNTPKDQHQELLLASVRYSLAHTSCDAIREFEETFNMHTIILKKDSTLTPKEIESKNFKETVKILSERSEREDQDRHSIERSRSAQG
jgi:hypothetical protein